MKTFSVLKGLTQTVLCQVRYLIYFKNVCPVTFGPCIICESFIHNFIDNRFILILRGNAIPKERIVI